MIPWGTTQERLNAAGYDCGRADGVAGPRTFTALYAFAAQRPADAAIELRGRRAAEHFTEFGMVTPARIAEFIAQCCNETGAFRRFEENLNYRADTLVRQWPSHFTPDQARKAVGNPVEIASRAYGGRMGNAAYPSMDGYKYRGRGDLQLTGKSNYARFGAMLHLDLVTQPDLAAGDAAPLIALLFFREGDVNAAVDRGDFLKARQITNGRDAIGLKNVAAIRNRILTVFA